MVYMCECCFKSGIVSSIKNCIVKVFIQYLNRYTIKKQSCLRFWTILYRLHLIYLLHFLFLPLPYLFQYVIERVPTALKRSPDTHLCQARTS